MGINLSKGQKVDLTKGTDIQQFVIGLGWDANDTTGQPFDLDVSAFVLGANKKVISEDHFVFYNNLKAPGESVVHTGDNLTGEGDGDDETVKVDFSRIEPEAEEIVFVVTIHDAENRKQTFGQVRKSFIRIMDPSSTELLKYELDEDFSIETSVEFGKLYKKDGEWKFDAVGTGQREGLSSYVKKYIG